MKQIITAILCALFLSVSSLSLADTIAYSNLDSGGAYNDIESWIVGSGFASGESFSLNNTITLTSVHIALSYFFGEGNPEVALYSDVNGTLGTELISWTVDYTTLPFLGDTNIDLVNLDVAAAAAPPAIPIELIAGYTYWLVASNGMDTMTFWNYSIAASGGHYQDGFVSDDIKGAFEILGDEVPANNPVPEPSTLFLLAAGLIGIRGIRGLRGRD